MLQNADFVRHTENINLQASENDLLRELLYSCLISFPHSFVKQKEIMKAWSLL